MSRQIVVTLGDREFAIAQLPIRPEAAWRQKLQAQLAPLLDLLQNIDRELNTPADVANLIRDVAPALLNAPDIMVDLLMAYAPALAAEADWIGDNAYVDQIQAALLEVVRLAYPFEPMLRTARSIGAPRAS